MDIILAIAVLTPVVAIIYYGGQAINRKVNKAERRKRKLRELGRL